MRKVRTYMKDVNFVFRVNSIRKIHTYVKNAKSIPDLPRKIHKVISNVHLISKIYF